MTKKNDNNKITTLHQPFDKFFKVALKEKAVMRDFLEGRLPDDLKARYVRI